jgi:predicted transcriptional regulator
MLDPRLLKLTLTELRAYLVLNDEKKDMDATYLGTKLKIQRAMASKALNNLHRFGLIHKYRRHRECFFTVIGGV